MAAEQFANDSGTTLSAAISSTTRPVTFSVTSGAGWPSSAQFRVVLGTGATTETLLVTAVNGGNSYTGTTAEGSTARTWINGSPVSHVLTAGALSQLKTDVWNGGNVNSVSFSATPAFDASLGRAQTITLTGNITSFTVSNLTAGQILIFDFVQDSTGGRTVSGVPSAVKGMFTPGTVASKHNVQAFYTPDGTNLYAMSTGVINI